MQSLSRFMLTGLSALSVMSVTPVQAEDWFNPALLGGRSDPQNPGTVSADVDDATLQRLMKGQQPPGHYAVDIYLNDQFIGKRDVLLGADGPDNTLTPTWTPDDVLAMGVKPEVLSADGVISLVPENGDVPVAGILNHVAGSQVRFDFTLQQLRITVPVLAMVRDMSGATDQRFWDSGIPALVTQYNLNVQRREDRTTNSGETDSSFLSLNNSLNIGPWRLHNFTTWSKTAERNASDNEHVTEEWESVNTWLERPIPAIKGILSVGDYYTPSDVFDSVQFRGAQVASDEDMNPDYMNDFSPVIRGIASTNAEVVVRQNNSVVYQTTVPPGPFAIADIQASSLSGDFYVTVTEADGSQHNFIQGNAVVAVMQRAGQLRYAMTYGQLRSSGSNTRTPDFAQGTLIYGLPWDLTLYGGLQVSNGYQAGSMGIGALLGRFGALSVDVTQASTELSELNGTHTEGKQTGQALRVRYSKFFDATGSTLSVSATRYSSEEYWTLGDANSQGGSGASFDPDNNNDFRSGEAGRPSKEVQLSLNQTLGVDLGSLTLSAIQKSWWDKEGKETSLSANWNVNIKGIGLGLGYQMNQWADDQQDDDQIVSLMVTLPLQQWLGTPNSLNSTSMYTKTKTTRTLNNNINGSFLEGNALSWSAGQSLSQSTEDGKSEEDNGNMHVSYSGGQGKVSVGYSYSPENKQYSAGLQGGVMLSQYGPTLFQDSGETMVLVRAAGADDVKVKSGTGLSTDWLGNTVVQVQPYRRNKIDLDPLSVGSNVTLGETSKVVIPTRGAVVLANYSTAVGLQLLMTLTRKGSPMPFGSMVSLIREDGKPSETGSTLSGGNGIVGDGGQVWLSGMPEEGVLTVTWAEGDAGKCRVTYRLNEDDIRHAEENNLPVMAEGVCESVIN